MPSVVGHAQSFQIQGLIISVYRQGLVVAVSRRDVRDYRHAYGSITLLPTLARVDSAMAPSTRTWGSVARGLDGGARSTAEYGSPRGIRRLIWALVFGFSGPCRSCQQARQGAGRGIVISSKRRCFCFHYKTHRNRANFLAGVSLSGSFRVSGKMQVAVRFTMRRST